VRVSVVALSLLLGGCSIVSGLDDFTIDEGVGGAALGGRGGEAGDGGDGGTPGFCPNFVLELTESTTDAVRTADAGDLDEDGSFTIEAWVRLDDAIGPMDEAHIVSHHDHDANVGWALLVKNTSLEFRVYDGAQKTAVGSVVPTEKWTHVAGTFDGVNVRAIVNGVRSTPVQASSPTDFMGPLSVGRAASMDGFAFLGRIDDVRLTGGAIYPADFAPPSAPLNATGNTVLLWRFQEEEGDAIDSAGNHVGRLVGQATRIDDACPLVAER
jgi:hypothetical protein